MLLCLCLSTWSDESPLPTPIFLLPPWLTFIPLEDQPEPNFPKSNRIRNEFRSKFLCCNAILWKRAYSWFTNFFSPRGKIFRYCCRRVSYTVVTEILYVRLVWCPLLGHLGKETQFFSRTESHQCCHQHCQLPLLFFLLFILWMF